MLINLKLSERYFLRHDSPKLSQEENTYLLKKLNPELKLSDTKISRWLQW